ncbi:MAG: hypothetical protein HETSPECPRED_002805 [Heterodermia speciosa]|uniref:Major facilitator superfamily (MFS) profile domain-containing protein n=1 Tax=Heterodermia speciosa TaxID=116794 RepID=A0A8H3I620_9LECA|nr:MAG: hypothetical protein HETSPECPRED_002805 [Heterodermia speciosa]
MTHPEASSGGSSQDESPKLPEKKESESMKSRSPSSQSQDLESQKEQSPESSTEPEAPVRQIRGLKWLIVVSAILSTTFLFSLDNTVVADIQPQIIERFGGISKLPWLGAAFALGSAASILPWSKSYGVFNLKWLYIATVALFEIGSAICGAAPNMNVMIVGRAIAGLGGSGMYVGCLMLLSVMTTIQERPMYMGLIGLIWAIGTVLGPVVGGGFADSKATWRWGFYINLVIGALVAPAILFLLPSINFQPDISTMQRLLQTDWLGIVFFAGLMCSFIMAISFGGSVFAWNSGSEIALWVVTGVLFIAFALTQAYHPFIEDRLKLYPTRFFKRPTLLMLQTCAFCAAFCLFIPTYYIPLFFQFARGDSALEAAVRLLPFISMVAVFSLINGSLMAKLGYYFPWYLLGGGTTVIGAALMYTVTSNTSPSAVYGYTVLLGIGAGSFLQASFGVSQALVAPEEIPDAVGLISVGQSIGIVISLAIAGSIYQNEAYTAIKPLLPPSIPAPEIRSAIAGTSSAVLRDLPQGIREMVIEAVVRTMDRVYILAIAGGALTVLLGVVMPKKKMLAS